MGVSIRDGGVLARTGDWERFCGSLLESFLTTGFNSGMTKVEGSVPLASLLLVLRGLLGKTGFNLGGIGKGCDGGVGNECEGVTGETSSGCCSATGDDTCVITMGSFSSITTGLSSALDLGTGGIGFFFGLLTGAGGTGNGADTIVIGSSSEGGFGMDFTCLLGGGFSS